MYDRLNWYKTLKKANHRQGRDTLSKPSKINSRKYFVAQEIFRKIFMYPKVASSRPVCYSILDHFVPRSQYISIKISLRGQSENPLACYELRQSTTRNFTLLIYK